MPKISIGVKTDPIHYRYSYEWLFDLLAEERVQHVQFGTFVELYHLPDSYFTRIPQQAEERGLTISSVFTSHRELGSFFFDAPEMEAVGRRNFERLIEVGALLGAKHVGSNPGAALRDRMGQKQAGLDRYIRHFKELMHHAHRHGIQVLNIEPMSCLAEPPTLPEEIRALGEELGAYHNAHPDTAAPGYCADVSHGYADDNGTVVHSNTELFEATLPWLREFHARNTDARFDSTFGFTPEERERGIVNLETFREILNQNEDRLPTNELTAYFEIGGPKLGRDYSDPQLEQMLRESLRHLHDIFEHTNVTT